MTKEQFKEFVATMIKKYEDDYHGKEDPIDEYTDKIVAQWESDVNDAKIAAVTEYQEKLGY